MVLSRLDDCNSCFRGVLVSRSDASSWFKTQLQGLSLEQNCAGCQYDSELITNSCPWRTDATRVGHRNTCRNSLPDRFLHDPFARHRNHAIGFQVLLRNTPKGLVQELFPNLLPSCGMPYHHRQSGKQTPWRRSEDV